MWLLRYVRSGERRNRCDSTASNAPCEGVEAAALAAARMIVTEGVGEGRPAHGFFIVVGNAEKILAGEKRGRFETVCRFGRFLNRYDYRESKILVQACCSGDEKRAFQALFLEDGAVVVDGQTGRVACGGFFVGDISRGVGGGARNKAASAIATQAGCCYVILASESICGSVQNPVLEGAAFKVFDRTNAPRDEPVLVRVEEAQREQERAELERLRRQVELEEQKRAALELQLLRRVEHATDAGTTAKLKDLRRPRAEDDDADEPAAPVPRRPRTSSSGERAMDHDALRLDLVGGTPDGEAVLRPRTATAVAAETPGADQEGNDEEEKEEEAGARGYDDDDDDDDASREIDSTNSLSHGMSSMSLLRSRSRLGSNSARGEARVLEGPPRRERTAVVSAFHWPLPFYDASGQESLSDLRSRDMQPCDLDSHDRLMSYLSNSRSRSGTARSLSRPVVAPDSREQRALEDALDAGDASRVEAALRDGADANLATEGGMARWKLPPTHRAASRGHLEIFMLLVEQWLCNPGVQDQKGWTALHHAANSGRANVVEYLVAKQCVPVDAEDIKG